MDLFKNVEVVLMLGFGVLCALAWGGQAPVAPAPAAASAQLQPPQQQPIVVVITGKRLSAAEKRAFDARVRSG